MLTRLVRTGGEHLRTRWVSRRRAVSEGGNQKVSADVPADTLLDLRIFDYGLEGKTLNRN